MGQKAKKSTRKFVKTKLQDAIKKRKHNQKVSTDKAKKQQKRLLTAQNRGQKESESEDDNIEEVEQGSDSDVGDEVFAKKFNKKDKQRKGESSDDEVDDDNDDAVSSGSSDSESSSSDAEENVMDEKELEDQIQKLSETDPSFYKFLKNSEGKELLQFKATDDKEGDEEQQEEEEEEEEEEAKPETKSAKRIRSIVLTPKVVYKWLRNAVKEGSLRSLRMVVVLFRTACHYNDVIGEKSNLPFASSMTADMSMLVILKTLKFARHMFDAQLRGDKAKTQGDEEDEDVLPSKSANWKKIEIICKSFLSNLLHLVKTQLNIQILQYVLKFTEQLVPYFAAFTRYARKFLKILLKHFAHEDESVRFRSFLNIRKLAITAPYPFIDLCLKGVYLTFVEYSKFYNVRRMKTLDFMMNCVVELYGVDMRSSYQHAFVYIRQLAVFLRRAITTSSKQSHALIHNWQFVNSLHVWCKVISKYSGEDELKALLYPVAQIIQGVIQLFPMAKYYPLRFLCVEFLNELAKSTGVFIPVTHYLLEVLESIDMSKKPKPSTAAVSMLCALKVKKANLKTKSFLDTIFEEALYYLLQHLDVVSRSISFPETIVPCILVLKKLRKAATNPKYSKSLSKFIDVIEKNVQLIQQKRAQADFTPQDLSKIRDFEAELADKNGTALEKYYEQERATRAAARDVKIKAKLESEDQDKYNSSDDEGEDDGDKSQSDSEDEQAKPKSKPKAKGKTSTQPAAKSKSTAQKAPASKEKGDKPAQKPKEQTAKAETATGNKATKRKRDTTADAKKPKKSAKRTKKNNVQEDEVQDINMADF